MHTADNELFDKNKAQLSTTESKAIVCHECEETVVVPALSHKQKAHCPRCGYQITQFHEFAIDRMIAYGLGAIIFLVLSIPFEFLSFNARGQGQTIDIITGINTLIEQEYLTLALIQLFAIIILPAMILLCLMYLLIPHKFGLRAPKGHAVLRLIYWLLPWSMAEIFLVGAMVSLIKINDMADVELGASFYAYICFTLCMIVTYIYMDKQQLMQMVNTHIALPKLTAKLRSQSIQKTWALLLTSIIFYIPANTLPIMHTRLLGSEEPSTILGGVILLWKMGSYPVAIIIFVASVAVPVAKIVILASLNFSVQQQLSIKTQERMFWYRVTEFIGRWSMVDVFVVAILVSLIQLGNTMSIYPGPAAIAFCAVVVLTMAAAMTFDTRLIWTNKDITHD